jgi:hypothetical protein
MPTKKGISKPRHKPETKDLAVSLYISNPRTTLKEVADQLNSMFHFDPPLSYDSIGRWVQEKKEKMKRPGDLIWVKRRQKYGKSGLKAEKRQALSRLRETQWSDPKYRQKMSERMSRIPQEVKKKIIDLYKEGTMPSKIKRILKSERMYVPAHSTFYQILNRSKWRINPIDSIIDIPCFVCLLNKEVSPFWCFPTSCLKLEQWLTDLSLMVGNGGVAPPTVS